MRDCNQLQRHFCHRCGVLRPEGSFFWPFFLSIIRPPPCRKPPCVRQACHYAACIVPHSSVRTVRPAWGFFCVFLPKQKFLVYNFLPTGKFLLTSFLLFGKKELCLGGEERKPLEHKTMGCKSPRPGGESELTD